jgi:peptide methionine sulfoxide reductase MsrB
MLDGKPAHIPVGTKVAIRHTSLEKHHNLAEHNGLSLGALQNHAEGGDHWVNRTYRILTKKHPDHPSNNEYESNTDKGIFPPLIDHDHEHHEWTKVGHARDIRAGEFRKLTKTKEHPKGISHDDFCKTLNRFHERNNGKYWKSPERDKHLDQIESHPLIQKFMDYHGNTGHPAYDYQQKKNLGVFEHPNGTNHIVARDHGFNSNVQQAYHQATMAKYNIDAKNMLEGFK